MSDITWMELIILILATFRLTRLIVFDEITTFIRNPFLKITYEKNDEGDLLETVEIRRGGLHYWIGMLLSCHWCVGIWASLVVVLIYQYIPGLNLVLLLLAIAGAASFIQAKIE
ncbi:DUF1360 domain-containing protein [Evansella sp. AB-rgal1]|uniref:DUF1360 domain-containing protein n=1 Tax=Evansella sp. AB-rgal1 TaxID=3242696 RepID=UPI00359CF26D